MVEITLCSRRHCVNCYLRQPINKFVLHFIQANKLERNIGFILFSGFSVYMISYVFRQKREFYYHNYYISLFIVFMIVSVAV